MTINLTYESILESIKDGDLNSNTAAVRIDEACEAGEINAAESAKLQAAAGLAR